ncbi:hypothetical protein PPL_01897 [Heterostelium album PN500]|uniref:Uncharacterized protein n=1 Tax=Heterostelium pallidum (strain ATCC 26659 / Pp 5 / PN500) TaxID=670386 RepID=D3B0T0_HETP5|nr:hypothetical protein PPL_01897 [Heterostelium album PN500]EFA84904.1 hypothetical protein PPL_01897 [Heterostelium album PN500]|eukprot:XP_020437014.1 hypothetical protein PPL_01897 [Heterostelium album PN500]
MGQSISNNKIISNKKCTIEIIKNNQTILPDLIWKYIVDLLSEDQCSYHQLKYNILSLSLISHYWMVNIIAKSSLRISTTQHKSKFFLNFPKSFKLSLLKLNNSNNNSENFKFYISKLTLKYMHHYIINKKNRIVPIEIDWMKEYKEAIQCYWSFDSLTVIDLPNDQDILKLGVFSTIRKFRIYSNNNFTIIDWSLFSNIEVLSIRNNCRSYGRPFILPNKEETAYQSLRSLSLSLQFNHKSPLTTRTNGIIDKDISELSFKNIRSLELNHYHFDNMTASTFDEVPIDLSKLFPNIESLKLNHIYHRLIGAANRDSLVERKSLLSRLTELRYLSITNGEKIYNNNETDNPLHEEYHSEYSLTSSVFKLDMASIGHQLETIKIKGKFSLFDQLFSVIEQLVCLKRLSIPSKELSLSNLKLLLKSTSLVRLTTLLMGNVAEDRSETTKLSNQVLDYFIKNNKNIKYLKVCRYRKQESEVSLLLNLLEKSTGFQDIRFICYNSETTNNFTLPNNITVSFIYESNYKQPKKGTKSDYLMGQSISNSNKISDKECTIEIIKNNQTILPDLIWRYIVDLFSEYQCRYHQNDFNVLSLSLISHYWLVNIIAKSSLRISTTQHKSKFFLNFPKSFKISLLKLNNNSSNNSNNSNENIKFNISKLTLKYEKLYKFTKKDRLVPIDIDWMKEYKEAIQCYWSFDSLTVIDLPSDQDILKLGVFPTIRKFRIYSNNNFTIIDWSLFSNIEVLSIRNNCRSYGRPFILPNKEETAYQSLRSLSLSLQFRHKSPLSTRTNGIIDIDISELSFKNIRSLELNYIHSDDMAENSFDEVPIDLSKLFPNIESLKLNHIYHRLIRAANRDSLVERKSLLSRLTELRYLSITNGEKIYNNNETDNPLHEEYHSEYSLTSSVFKLDMASIGHQLETIKIKGKFSLFDQLFSVIEQLVCLKRLSIPSKELSLSNLKLLLKSTSLVRLTTLLMGNVAEDRSETTKLSNQVLDYFIKNNKNIKYLKVCRYRKQESECQRQPTILHSSTIRFCFGSQSLPRFAKMSVLKIFDYFSKIRIFGELKSVGNQEN